VVFVRKVCTASGATAVQIAERQDGRDKVLEHLGSAHTEAELTALLETARTRIYPGQGELDLSAGSVPAGQSVITSKSSALLWHVLTAAYARLGFDALGDEAFKQLVLARLVEPTSKADSIRVLDGLGVPHASLRTMFRSLARCQDRGYRDQVATACFSHHQEDRPSPTPHPADHRQHHRPRAHRRRPAQRHRPRPAPTGRHTKTARLGKRRRQAR